MGQKKENKSGKKGAFAIIVAILVPILLIVMLVSSFFAILSQIIEWIVTLIQNIVDAILEFFKNPLEAVEKLWAGVTNWWNESIDNEDFDPTAIEAKRTDPAIVINKESVEEQLKKIDSQINRDIAGLDNLTIKKMLLAYYRGLYLDDTTILVEITREDFGFGECTCGDLNYNGTAIDFATYESQMCESCKKWFNLLNIKYKKTAEGENVTKEGILGGAAVGAVYGSVFGPVGTLIGGGLGGIAGGILDSFGTTYYFTLNEESDYASLVQPFDLMEGDPDKGFGEDGHIYIKSKGMLQIFVDGTSIDKCKGCTTEKNRENCKYTTDGDASTVCYYKLKYYSDVSEDENGNKNSPLESVYKKYKDAFDISYEIAKQKAGYEKYDSNIDDSGYVKAVKEYMLMCYTYNGDGSIKMYSRRETSYTEQTWKYEKEGKERRLTPMEAFPLEAETINYEGKVIPYTTPVEFMINLMEITSSKDFINAFIETVGNENYIKMRLYTVNTVEEKVVNETKDRITTVKINNRDYGVKVIEVNEDNIFEEWGWKETDEKDTLWTLSNNNSKYINFTEENGDVKITPKIDDLLKIKLYTYDENSASYIPLPEKNEIELDKDNPVYDTSYTFPYPIYYTDTSKIEEEKITTTTTEHYNIGITELKTWYEDSIVENIVNADMFTKIKKPIINSRGNQTGVKDTEVNIENIETLIKQENGWNEIREKIVEKASENKVVESNRSYKWYNRTEWGFGWKTFQEETINGVTNKTDLGEGRYSTKKSIGYSAQEKYSMIDCLNVQYLKTLETRKPFGAVIWTSPDHDKFNIMSAEDSSILSATSILQIVQRLDEGERRGRTSGKGTDYNLFLGLLSNETGIYESGRGFKPITSGGKVVEYDTVYGGKVKVADLLINGADMLDQLLRSNATTDASNLDELADAIEEALKQYKVGAYSITNSEDIEY